MTKREKLEHILKYSGSTEISIRRISNTLYRIGYCCQCGSCCKNIDIQVRISANVETWLAGYGITVKKEENIYETEEENKNIDYTALISIPVQCKYLKQVDNCYTCENYNARPAICQAYPKSPSKWPTCTYVFVEEEELKWFLDKYNKEQKDGKKEIRFHN